MILSSHKPKGHHGFTLVELLVVIAIIGILVALLLPAIQAAREAARRMNCSNKFKQVALALHTYHDSHDVFAPGSFTYRTDDCPPAGNPSSYYGWGWATFILPYIEMSAAYDEFNFTGWYNNSTSYRAAGVLVSAYLCPSDPQNGEYMEITGATGPDGQPNQPDGRDFSITNMAGVTDSTNWKCTYFPKFYRTADGMMGDRQGCRIRDVVDGTSNTLMIAEVTGAGGGTRVGKTWVIFAQLDTYEGINGPSTIQGGISSAAYNFRTSGPASYHPGGCHFAMGDGSVRFFADSIDRTVLRALTTRDGKESVQIP